MRQDWLIRRGRWVKLDGRRQMLRVPLFWPIHASHVNARGFMRDQVFRSTDRGVPLQTLLKRALAQAEELDAAWEMPRPTPVEGHPPVSTLRVIEAGVPIELTLRREGRVLMTTSVAPELVARPGKGSTGHLILDRYLDTHGIPEQAVGHVMEAVHARQGYIADGVAEIDWRGRDFKKGLKLLAELRELLAP